MVEVRNGVTPKWVALVNGDRDGRWKSRLKPARVFFQDSLVGLLQRETIRNVTRLWVKHMLAQNGTLVNGKVD